MAVFLVRVTLVTLPLQGAEGDPAGDAACGGDALTTLSGLAGWGCSLGAAPLRPRWEVGVLVGHGYAQLL